MLTHTSEIKFSTGHQKVFDHLCKEYEEKAKSEKVRSAEQLVGPQPKANLMVECKDASSAPSKPEALSNFQVQPVGAISLGQLNGKEGRLSIKAGAIVEASENSKYGGGLWDIFQREDVQKLQDYLRKHPREFRYLMNSCLKEVGISCRVLFLYSNAMAVFAVCLDSLLLLDVAGFSSYSSSDILPE